MTVIRTEGSNKEEWVPRLCTHCGQPYAILSHRWLTDPNEEVLFADIQETDRSDSLTNAVDQVKVVTNAHYIGTTPVRGGPISWLIFPPDHVNNRSISLHHLPVESR